MLLAEIVDASARVAATRSRLAKVEILAEVLGHAAPAELEVATVYLAGVLRQRRTGLGWRSTREAPPAADEPSLEVLEVDAVFTELAGLSGPGSRSVRESTAAALFGRATARRAAVAGGRDHRQRPAGRVRRARPGGGGEADRHPGRSGAVGRDAGRLHPGRGRHRRHRGRGRASRRSASRWAGRCCRCWPPASPIPPPRGSGSAPREVAVEWKLDGIRLQAHKVGDRVLLATRTLEDITDRLPEVVEVVRALPAERAVIDGEALAVGPDGRPRPFQETASRTASGSGVAITPYFFDLLHLDGEDLLDLPASERSARLTGLVPEPHRIPREVVSSPEDVARVFDAAVAAGQEGVVVKSLTTPYAAGRRGAGWVKVKPVHTLDLVVLAVEEGSGRRKGWLSNIHLGARDPAGGFVMLGKTFKGMTDEMLAWQTERFTELMTERDDWVVHVRPEQVVEIAFDGLQRSSRYPGGLALRFARVIRYRDDKTADEADTIDDVRRLAGH